MITEDDAKVLFNKYLENLEVEIGFPLVMLDSSTIEKPFFWIFFYNSSEFVKDGNLSARLAGNAPVVISKIDGTLIELTTDALLTSYLD